MEKIIEIVSSYGPFPFGIVVGIYLAKAAYDRATGYLHSEVSALRDEKKHLRETITNQQKRIDVLHDKIFKIGQEET